MARLARDAKFAAPLNHSRHIDQLQDPRLALHQGNHRLRPRLG
jgi:hypothetical protein